MTDGAHLGSGNPGRTVAPRTTTCLGGYHCGVTHTRAGLLSSGAVGGPPRRERPTRAASATRATRATRATPAGLGIALALLVATGGGAQQSEPNVSGRVLSLDSIPVAGVEVRLEGTALLTRTDTRGAFAFVGAPGGTQDVSVRGVGYLPAHLPVRVPETSAGLVITLLPAPRLLDSVRVRERMNVLSGIVVDEFSKPVAGATIEVVAGDRRTVTSGDDGWFALTSLRDGLVVFRTRKEGYFMTNTAVRLAEWRGIVVRLESLPKRMGATAQADASGESNNAIAAWRDAAIRMSMRAGRAVILSEEELAPFADVALGRAIGLTKSGAPIAIDIEHYRGAVCVLLNGRRPVGSTTLDTWRADDVEMVELYPPGTDASGTIGRYLRTAGCRAEYRSNRTRGPFYAVLWMK